MGLLKAHADAMSVAYTGWYNLLGSISSRLDSAGGYLKLITPNFYWAGVELEYAGQYVNDMRAYLDVVRDHQVWCFYYVEDNYAVTWESICEAWAKDDFAGRVMTIGFIDRMRQILWDEPYYIAWAARPEQQD